MRRPRHAAGFLTLVVLAAGIGYLAAPSAAATPDRGRITLSHHALRWQGQQWVAGAGYALHVEGLRPSQVETVCPPEAADPLHLQCDHFHLTVDVPASYWRRHPGGVKVSVGWPNPGNKVLLGVYDSSGKWLGFGYGADPASVVIADAHGDYDLAVEPLIVTSPTAYAGYARTVALPPADPHPSVGGPATWRAQAVAHLDPDRPPANLALPDSGPDVALSGHAIGATAIEPAIGMTRTGALFVDGIRPGARALYGIAPELRRSRDAGRHWDDGGGGAATTHGSSNDPLVYVDPVTGRVFWLDQVEVNGAALSYSDDDGATWTNTAITTGVNDHPTLGTGVVPAGSALVLTDPKLPRIVYYCSNAVASADCQRSLDGGLSFSKVGSPFLDQSAACPAVGTEFAHLSTDAAGRVYLGAANCGIPEVAYSEDAGVTWTNVVVSSTLHAAGHDVETAVDGAGVVYALWTDDQDSLPYLSRSRDHGRTWSTPLLAAPPGVHETSYATLTAGSAGRVAVSFVGTTVDNTADPHRPWAFFTAISVDALSPEPLFHSNSAVLDDGTRVVNRGDCCAGFQDFLGSMRSPLAGGAVLSATDVACSARCARNPLGIDDAGRRSWGYAVVQTGGPALVGPR